MAKKIIIELPEVGKACITIADNKLYQFSKRQLDNYIIQKSESIIEKDTLPIVEFEFFDLKFNHTTTKRCRIKHLTFTDSIYLSYERNFKVTIHRSGKYFYFLRPILLGNYPTNHSNFYRLVLYPILFVYNYFFGYVLNHGALLKKSKKSFILTGKPGTGKSTLSTILNNSGYSVLADNFILSKNDKVIGLNLPVRVDNQLRYSKEKVIYQNRKIKEIRLNTLKPVTEKVDRIFILEIGDNNIEISSIHPKLSLSKLEKINSKSPEINDAIFFVTTLIKNMHLKQKQKTPLKIRTSILRIPKGKLEQAIHLL